MFFGRAQFRSDLCQYYRKIFPVLFLLDINQVVEFKNLNKWIDDFIILPTASRGTHWIRPRVLNFSQLILICFFSGEQPIDKINLKWTFAR